MGADFLVVAVPAWAEADAEPLKRFIRRAIEEGADLREVVEFYTIDGDEEPTSESIAARLCSTVDELTGSRRDTVTICLDGKNWLLAGGMSWGDDPSDAFGLVGLLATGGLVDRYFGCKDEEGG